MSLETLQVIWFILWGTLWAVYFMLDGFDLGVGMLYPILGKDQSERRLMLNAIGPFWDGNEVWLITAGGATFAAFPTTYADMFSYLYTPLILILSAIIFRGVAIEYMNKIDGDKWRDTWMYVFSIASLLVAVLFGVAFSNIFMGLPMDANGFHGNLLTLLNPYGLLGGILFALMFLVTGAVWVAIKTEPMHERAMQLASRLWPYLLGVAVIYLIYTFFVTHLYDNYLKQPVLILIPLVAVASLLLIKVYLAKGKAVQSFVYSSLFILSTVYFGVVGLFPNLIPSSIDPQYSLTLFNSSASQYTLTIMFIVAIIFVPIVILYQFFVYKMFSGKVTTEDKAY